MVSVKQKAGIMLLSLRASDRFKRGLFAGLFPIAAH